MKLIVKSLLSLFLIFSVSGAFAQKKDLQTAKNRLKSGEYEKALEYLNSAFETGKLDDNGDALITKYQIYKAVAKNSPDLLPDAEQKTSEAMLDVLKKDPKTAVISIPQDIDALVNSSFSDGVKAYNDKDYPTAIAKFNTFNALYDATGKLLYSSAPIIDTINAQATLYKAFALQEDGQLKQSEEVLSQLKSNPYLSGDDEANVYRALINQYKKAGDDDKLLAVLNDANKKLPDNNFVVAEEIAYYDRKGETEKLLARLDDAIAKDPQNSMNYYNKGVVLTNMAFPESGEAPENYDELIAQATSALDKAAELNPDDVNVMYMQGYTYYNQAQQLQEKISNATDEELPKLNRDRLILFNKALPYMTSALALLDKVSPSKISAAQKQTAYNVGIALKSIYGLDNDTEKINSVNDFLKKFGLN